MTEISNWKKVDSDNVKIDDLTLSAPQGNYWQKMMGAIARKFSAVDTKLEKVEGALVRRGEKATVSALPATGNSVGDYWSITADGSEWAWDGTEWYEIGNDDAVHKSGAETISGVKTIANVQDAYPDIAGSKNSVLRIRIPDYIKGGDGPPARRYASLCFVDNDPSYTGPYQNNLGHVEMAVYPAVDGIVPHRIRILCYSFVPGRESEYTALQVGYDSQGRAFALAPTTRDDSDDTTEIITRSYLTGHYGKRLEYTSQPIFEATIASDWALADNPYTITSAQLGGDYVGIMLYITGPTAAAAASSYIDVTLDNDAVLSGVAHFAQANSPMYSSVEVRPEAGIMRLITNRSSSSTRNMATLYAVPSETQFIPSAGRTIEHITFSTAATGIIPADTHLQIFGLEEA